MSKPDKQSRAMALSALFATRVNQKTQQSQDGDTSTTDPTQHHQLHGPRPSTEELWNWMHNDVSAARAAEIRSHLAYDSEIYENWRQLRIAHEDVHLDADVSDLTDATPVSTEINTSSLPSEQQNQKNKQGQSKRIWPFPRLENWFPLAGAIGALGLVLLISVLIKPALEPVSAIDFWQHWQTPKSGVTRTLSSTETKTLQVILNGMRQALAANNLPTIDPDGVKLKSASCEGENPCVSLEQELLDLGKHLTNLRLSCLQGKKPAADTFNFFNNASLLGTQEALKLLEAPLRQLSYELSSLSSLPTQSDTSNNSFTLVCNAADATIERALLAR